jgi:polar amino acid transport system ATP-binding protein
MIKLENISKKYNKNYAIKNISLQFGLAETIAIIGPSGSGKSTLLRCINRLEEPTSGQVFINNEKLTARNRRKLCLKIGMVFQNFNLFPHMNVKDNLIYSPLNVLGVQKNIAEEKAEHLLEKFSLKQKLSSKPSDLSGGQKQRVAICRALMMNPEIILFDEPTSSLDPEVIKDIIDAILILKSQITMIVVTHHLKFAKSIADRIIFMDHGQALADQKVSEFFEKPSSHRARLFLENIGDLI